MSDGNRRSFPQMLGEAFAAAQRAQAIAHGHAEEFGRALRDEIASAERVGACVSCINNELTRMTADRLVAAQGNTPLEGSVRALEEASKAFTAALMIALIRREAQKQAAVLPTSRSGEV